MIEESARVVAIDGQYALVETQRKSTCESCAVNKGCGTAVISKVLGRAPIQLRAINRINARLNEQVVIGIEERWLLRSSFVAYIVPLLLMLLCAAIGEMMGAYLWGEETEGLTILAAFFGLFVGFLWLRRYTRNLRQQKVCQPMILRSVSNEIPVQFNNSARSHGQD